MARKGVAKTDLLVRPATDKQNDERRVSCRRSIEPAEIRFADKNTSDLNQAILCSLQLLLANRFVVGLLSSGV